MTKKNPKNFSASATTRLHTCFGRFRVGSESYRFYDLYHLFSSTLVVEKMRMIHSPLAVVVTSSLSTVWCSAFMPLTRMKQRNMAPAPHLQQQPFWIQPTAVSSSLLSSSLDDFSNFAASLEESSSSRPTSSKSINGDNTAAFTSSTKKTAPTTARSTPKAATTSNNSSNQKSWQDDLEELLFRLDTTPARRQILLQQLINANHDIRKSVEMALQQRNVRTSNILYDLE